MDLINNKLPEIVNETYKKNTRNHWPISFIYTSGLKVQTAGPRSCRTGTGWCTVV